MLFSWDLVNKKRAVIINKSEVLRYLGYKSENHQINKRVLKIIDQELEIAYKFIKPQGFYCIYEGSRLRWEKIFSDAEKVGFGVCTIGDGLERRVKWLFDQEEGAKGVVLDAIGSVAAEAVTNMVNDEISNWAARKGLLTTRRFSPGYGSWKVEGQELVFAHLKDAESRAGVKLTSSKMMVPVKSVSFAIKIGRRPMEEINKGYCESCTMYGRCPFQHKEAVCRRAAKNF